jgi:hypothetical protein
VKRWIDRANQIGRKGMVENLFLDFDVGKEGRGQEAKEGKGLNRWRLQWSSKVFCHDGQVDAMTIDISLF